MHIINAARFHENTRDNEQNNRAKKRTDHKQHKSENNSEKFGCLPQNNNVVSATLRPS